MEQINNAMRGNKKTLHNAKQKRNVIVTLLPHVI